MKIITIFIHLIPVSDPLSISAQKDSTEKVQIIITLFKQINN